jgi:DNA-binding CsgD family transcriptional regulator
MGLADSQLDFSACDASRRLRIIDKLSPREREVLGYAALGGLDHEIAQRMMISHRTVRHYFTTLFRKLSVRGRVDVAVVGLVAHVASCDECFRTISHYRTGGQQGRGMQYTPTLLDCSERNRSSTL